MQGWGGLPLGFWTWTVGSEHDHGCHPVWTWASSQQNHLSASDPDRGSHLAWNGNPYHDFCGGYHGHHLGGALEIGLFELADKYLRRAGLRGGLVADTHLSREGGHARGNVSEYHDHG